MKIINQSVEYIASTPNIGEVIEQGLRQCYRSENFIKEGSAEKIFKQVVTVHKHDSVCEHGSITVRVTTDRAVLAQFTRHRIGFSYSVESQRYVNYSKDKFGSEIEFIKPKAIETEKQLQIWEASMKSAEENYMNLLAEGLKAEAARSVLPNSTATRMVITGNIRAWRHFFELRKPGTHAQAEIQEISALLYQSFIENGIP
jgi:thymidylate synthase (FAD)